MENKDIIFNAEKLIEPFVYDFETIYQTKILWIKFFGSRIDNTYKDDSDLDIAIFCSDPSILAIDQNKDFASKWRGNFSTKIARKAHLVLAQHDNYTLLNNIENNHKDAYSLI